MASDYPINYPSYVNSEGKWPENGYIQPYPSEYYYGQNPYGINPPIDQQLQHSSPELNNDHHRSDSNYTPAPLAIRRHAPGSTDPTLQQLSSPSPSLKSNARVTFKEHTFSPAPARIHSPVTADPDERPIRPMKNTSVYTKPPSIKKIIPLKKPSSPPKPVYSPPVSPRRYESDSFQAPPSRTRMNDVPLRRPIRTDLIPRTPFGIPLQRTRSRKVVVEEYDDDYPLEYVNSTPRKVISYQEVPGMTTREMENYQMSRPQRIIRVKTPPIRTVIYRTH